MVVRLKSLSRWDRNAHGVPVAGRLTVRKMADVTAFSQRLASFGPDWTMYHSACSRMSAAAALLTRSRGFFTVGARARGEQEAAPYVEFQRSAVRSSDLWWPRSTLARDCPSGVLYPDESVRARTRLACPNRPMRPDLRHIASKLRVAKYLRRSLPCRHNMTVYEDIQVALAENTFALRGCAYHKRKRCQIAGLRRAAPSTFPGPDSWTKATRRRFLGSVPGLSFS